MELTHRVPRCPVLGCGHPPPPLAHGETEMHQAALRAALVSHRNVSSLSERENAYWKKLSAEINLLDAGEV